VAYSFFGEKFPWLSVHTTLPMIVLAGYTAGKLASQAGKSLKPSAPPRWVSVSHVARRWAVPALLAAVLLPIAAFSVWTGLRVTYGHGDEAREPLIYTQTTPDVPNIANEIDTIAGRSGLGDELRIQVDRTYTWPWSWYLRDYDVTFDFLTLEFTPEPGAIVMVSSVNDAVMNPFRDDYGVPRPFVLREWFAEDYRGIGDSANVASAISGFVSDVFQGSTWENWWDFMVHRDLPRSGFTGFVYVPREYGAIEVVDEPPDTPDDEQTPTVGPDIEGRIIVGELGEAPGQFMGPIGVALDGDGNPHVVDNGNDRIQRFDFNGAFASVVGIPGDLPGQFTQPSDIAVDADGVIWVADTWNHRIQKLGPGFSSLLIYGRPTNDLINPADDALWGPRGITIDRDGNILFTDTGTHRVRKIAPDGTHIASFGRRGDGPGEFTEPVGITVGHDGAIFVADAGNARIQKFDAEYTFVAEFPIEEWADRDPRNKPHLEAMPDGRLLATDGPNGRLLVIDENGTVQARLDAVAEVPLFFPAGVAFDAERGFVWVTDSAASHMWRFPLSDFARR
jgi:DNA-binding beta-propeller fold protein YncE